MNSVTIAGGSVRNAATGAATPISAAAWFAACSAARSMPSRFVSLPGHADHVVAAAHTDPVVAVRDPALERLGIVLRFAQEAA